MKRGKPPLVIVFITYLYSTVHYQFCWASAGQPSLFPNKQAPTSVHSEDFGYKPQLATLGVCKYVHRPVFGR